MKPTRVAPPLARLEPHLEGLCALDAARAVADPGAALAQELDKLALDRARLVIDVFEERTPSGVARKTAGVYYTPPHVIDAMLERLALGGVVLDPAAGAGAFVLALARRFGATGLSRLHACDVDAQALEVAALALGVAFGVEARPEIAAWKRDNTHHLDFLRAAWPGPAPQLIVGNPPYGRVPDLDLAARFPALRGERDLYACFVLRALDVVAADGTVALLVPDTWLTNARAAALRTELLKRSGLARVVDFGKPFASAPDTRVHALVLRRDATRCEVESERGAGLEPMAAVERATLETRAAAGWFLYRRSDEARACAALEKSASRLGDVLEVLYGLRTGDNAAHVSPGDGAVPLVGGIDLEPYDRSWAAKHLASPAEFPRQLGRQRGRWKLGIQRIRTNSRISWRRWLEAAPVTPREVGLDSLTLLAEREPTPSRQLSPRLLAALGVVNSSVLNRWYRLAFTDVNVKPAYVGELPLPAHDDELAALVRRRLGAPGDHALERAIDRLVAHAYGLSARDLDVLENGFWGDERTRRPMPSLSDARALVRPSGRARG